MLEKKEFIKIILKELYWPINKMAEYKLFSFTSLPQTFS